MAHLPKAASPAAMSCPTAGTIAALNKTEEMLKLLIITFLLRCWASSTSAESLVLQTAPSRTRFRHGRLQLVQLLVGVFNSPLPEQLYRRDGMPTSHFSRSTQCARACGLADRPIHSILQLYFRISHSSAL